MNSPKSHITIHDLARELGISASTVSRALQNNPRISVRTRQLVRGKAEAYGYMPNRMASSLRSGRGNTVGVIVPNINRSFFSNIIGGMEEILSAAGYNLMICQSHEKLENEKRALQTLINARVDGILMSLSMETSGYAHLEPLLASGINMVFFDRIPMGMEIKSVVIDDRRAAFEVTDQLIRAGYRYPAHVGGSESINVYANRLEGFLDALHHHNLPVNPAGILHEEMTLEGGSRAFRILNGQLPRPDAVICSGDFTALGVMQAAKEAGLQIPDDLAITGFSNEDFTSFIEPSLTTVDQRSMEMGRAAAALFLDSIPGNNGTMPGQVIMHPEILFRGSTLLSNFKN